MYEVIPYALIAAMGVRIWRLTVNLQELKVLSDTQVAVALARDADDQAKIKNLTDQLAAAVANAADQPTIDAIAANLNKLTA